MKKIDSNSPSTLPHKLSPLTRPLPTESAKQALDNTKVPAVLEGATPPTALTQSPPPPVNERPQLSRDLPSPASSGVHDARSNASARSITRSLSLPPSINNPSTQGTPSTQETPSTNGIASLPQARSIPREQLDPRISNIDPWRPLQAPITNAPDQRDPARYAEVIDQFGVEQNRRYAPNRQGLGETYCNIFSWDVTKAMGAEIPHWVDRAGNPAQMGERGARELTANATVDWLNQHGERHGWREATAQEAQEAANNGQPAVAAWQNPRGIGHIGIIRPGEITERGPALAQAGEQNLNDAHLLDGFGRATPSFWIHD